MAEDIDNLDDIVSHLIVKPGQKAEAKPTVSNEGSDTREDEPPEVAPVVKKAQETPKPALPDEGPDEELRPDVEAEEEVDIDEIPLDVLVDGQTQKVKIKDLKQKYSHVGAVEKRLEEATKGREVVQRQSQEMNVALSQMAGRLEALDAILAEAEAPQVDMDELRVKDPTRYLFEKERAREIQEKRGRIAWEQERLARHQEGLRQQALSEYLQNEHKALAQVFPEFVSPATAKETKDKLYTTAEKFGYSRQEVDSVKDHRAILVLRDAQKWRDYQASQQKVQQEARTEPRPLLKPGVKKSQSATPEARQMRALRAKARETGKPEDVAATLIVRSRR